MKEIRTMQDWQERESLARQRRILAVVFGGGMTVLLLAVFMGLALTGAPLWAVAVSGATVAAALAMLPW